MTRPSIDEAIEELSARFWNELMERVGTPRTLADVREGAVRAIRALEAHLVKALDDKKLRIKSMPNIGSKSVPIKALRIRGKFSHSLECFDPTNPRGEESSAVVLDDTGRLCVVTASIRGDVQWRPARDEDLVAEDLKWFWDALRFVLANNRRADRLGELAADIVATLDEIKSRHGD